MTQETLSAFFGWLTVLHFGFFALTAVLLLTMRERIAGLHGRMFGMPPQAANRTIYAWLGAYKLLILVTALGPWIALQII